MPRVAPQPAAENLSTVAGHGLESLELIIAHHFKAESNREQHDAQAPEDVGDARLATPDAEHPQDRLQHHDGAETNQRGADAGHEWRSRRSADISWKTPRRGARSLSADRRTSLGAPARAHTNR